jgi:hypothetical protein
MTGTNNGKVTVKSGGVIRNGTGVNIGGTGTNVVEAGGTVYFNGDATPFVGTNNSPVFQLGTNATFAYNNAGYAEEERPDFRQLPLREIENGKRITENG